MRMPKWRWMILATFAVSLTAALSAHEDTARFDVSLDAMIGQMLLIGFTGTSADGEGARRITEQIAKGEIGGVILMDRNIRSRTQVKTLTSKFRSARQELMPIISVDQEGGNVQRLSSRRGFGSYPMARSVGRRYTPEKALTTYRKMARELAETGINLNYGPVVDLDLYRWNPIIGRKGRSYGDDPEKVVEFARAFITAHREANVLTCIKHFPGHGSSRTDSHKRLVDLTKSWKEIELEPYRALKREGLVDTIMVGHLFLPRFSGEGRLPATLAPGAIEGWIRDDLGFDGVVITDDLEMAAVKKHHSLEKTLVMAINSGNDILMFASPDAGFVPRATKLIADAVEAGDIKKERIEQAYSRIVALKKKIARAQPWLAGLPAEVP